MLDSLLPASLLLVTIVSLSLAAGLLFGPQQQWPLCSVPWPMLSVVFVPSHLYQV